MKITGISLECVRVDKQFSAYSKCRAEGQHICLVDSFHCREAVCELKTILDECNFVQQGLVKLQHLKSASKINVVHLNHYLTKVISFTLTKKCIWWLVFINFVGFQVSCCLLRTATILASYINILIYQKCPVKYMNMKCQIPCNGHVVLGHILCIWKKEYSLKNLRCICYQVTKT